MKSKKLLVATVAFLIFFVTWNTFLSSSSEPSTIFLSLTTSDQRFMWGYVLGEIISMGSFLFFIDAIIDCVEDN